MATWSLCTGSVTGNAVTAGIGLAAVVAIADTLGMHQFVGVGAAAVGGLCTVLMSGFGNAEAIGVHLARWAAAGLWVTVVLSLSSPWSVGTVGALAVGCVVGAALGPMVARHAADTTRQGGGLVLGSVAKEAEEWRARITDRGGKPFEGTVVETVTRWENGNGVDVRVCLPRSGATVDQLRYLAPGLAGDANLPHGCSIEVIEPEDEGQRTVIMRVPTRVMSVLDEGHPLWEEQRSILDGVPIGAFANGDTVEAPMREESWLVVGKKGSGKTTLLFGITATVGMCKDALVWHIDLNNGALSQPWVDSWMQGKSERPPVDWAAPTIDEAIKMTAAAVRIAKHRKAAYRARKKAANTNLLPIGPDLPEIVMVLDEGAEAMLAAGKGKVVELAANLEEIQRIARDAAVNPILSVLRGTGDLVPAAMKTQTGVAICMKVREQKEIAQVFEEAWDLKLKPEHLTAKGAGWIGIDGANPVRYQGWNILPDDMEQAALRIARVRPDLDAASAEAAGQDYATRYERMRALFVEDGEIVEEEPEPAQTSGTWTADWNLFGTGPAPSQPRPTAGRTTLPEGEDGIEDAEIVEDAPTMTATVPLTEEVLKLFAHHGADKLPGQVIADALTGGDKDRLRFLLKADGVSPLKDPFRWGGELTRGYARADVEAATGP